MIGDNTDMVARLRAVLPARWFGDETPLLDAVLGGIGSAWSAVYALIAAVRGQARIGTASGQFLDMAAADFFPPTLLTRRNGETDDGFRPRIQRELLRERGTRAALVGVLSDLTGRAPVVFEPGRSGDAGGYGSGGAGYGVAGGYGSLALPYAVFVTAYRPHGGGIALLAGYGSGGVPAYGDAAMVQAPVSDAEIMAAVAGVLPAAVSGWVRISD
ncbi:MAG TPA: hypothetical protein VMI52_10045 [Acetobacteraceae bacterium]|nr:hypothetical protein [Acetobacteraceae bacterium]